MSRPLSRNIQTWYVSCLPLFLLLLTPQPFFRINDLVTRSQSKVIEKIVNREAKHGAWLYYVVNQLSTPRKALPPEGNWYHESELKPADTAGTAELYEALTPSQASQLTSRIPGLEHSLRNPDTESSGVAPDLYTGDHNNSPAQTGSKSDLDDPSANQPLSPETSYVDYLMPLLEKQMHILTWAMLETVTQ